jgi:hypothetical protein
MSPLMGNGWCGMTRFLDRLRRLERTMNLRGTDFDRWLRSLSDEALDAEIDERVARLAELDPQALEDLAQQFPGLAGKRDALLAPEKQSKEIR